MQVLLSVSKFFFPSLLLAKRERTEMICHLIQALLCFYSKSVSQERVGDYRANNCFPPLVSLEIFAWTPLDPFPAFLSSFISHFCSSVLITSEPVPLTKLLIFFYLPPVLSFASLALHPCRRYCRLPLGWHSTSDMPKPFRSSFFVFFSSLYKRTFAAKKCSSLKKICRHFFKPGRVL